MKHIAFLTAAFLYLMNMAYAQSTTSTNCNSYGSTTNCTSNTTDYGAQNQRAYQQGQQVGSALGQGLANAMQAHSFNKGVKKYCAAHPGERWTWRQSDGRVLSSGYCPNDEDKASAVIHTFMSKHKDFVPCSENSEAVTGYLEAKNLNPLEEKSYERAFKDLRSAGQIRLYSK